MAEGKRTDLNPSILQRASEAFRYALSGVKPTTWFSPSQPIQPVAPREDVVGRRYDFPVGFNLNYTPRSGSPIDFMSLRLLADNCDLIRLAIETRKDQLEGLDWNIRPRDKDSRSSAKNDPRIQELVDFFQSPDKNLTWHQWLRQLGEELFVTDAVSIYRRLNRGGKLYALQLIDGTTIKPLIDEKGYTPIDPDPAYQQILKGIPAVDYTARELIYAPRNRRVFSAYGFPNVEQIVTTVAICIKRAKHQLDYYTEGNIPDALLTGPEQWKAKDIEEWQAVWDAMLSGDTGARRHGRWVPNGTKAEVLKQPPLKDQYDEWLARVVCYCFSLPHDAFVQQVNRATAETSTDRALKEGLNPLKRYIKGLMDKVIREDFGYGDLEFVFEDNESENVELGNLQLARVKAGVITEDEERERLGKEPYSPEQLAEIRAARQPKAFGQPQQGDGEEDPKAKGKKQPDDEETQKHSHSHLKKSNDPPSLKGIHAQTDEALRLKSELKKKISSVLKATERSVCKQIEEGTAYLKKAQAGQDLQKRKGDEKSPRPANPSDDTIATVTLHPASANAEDSIVALTGLDEATSITLTVDLTPMNTLADDTLPLLADAGRDAGSRALASVGVSQRSNLVNQVNQRAVAYAEQRSAEMVGMRRVGGVLVPNPNAEMVISESTREQLREIISEGLAENIGKDEIIQRILDSTTFSEERAALIAATEIGNANSMAALEGFKAAADLGIIVKKAWLVDDAPCLVCEANAAVGAIALDEEFPSGDIAPLAHPNCECSLVSSIADDET